MSNKQPFEVDPFENPFLKEKAKRNKKDENMSFDSWFRRINIFYGFFHRPIHHHIIFILLLAIFLIIIIQISLYFYTNHNSYLVVPNFQGTNIYQVKDMAQKNNLKYSIVDSFYDKKFALGTIINQNPQQGKLVKQNRTIYLTKNVSKLKKIPMPNLLNKNVVIASQELDNLGLAVDNIVYVEDLTKNVVIGQSINGINIPPGTLIPYGSLVDLLVSKGIDNINEYITIPNLVGLSIEEFEYKLQEYGIKYVIVNREYMEDSNYAEDNLVVAEQEPISSDSYGEVLSMNKNSTIKLWLRKK